MVENKVLLWALSKPPEMIKYLTVQTWCLVRVVVWVGQGPHASLTVATLGHIVNRICGGGHAACRRAVVIEPVPGLGVDVAVGVSWMGLHE